MTKTKRSAAATSGTAHALGGGALEEADNAAGLARLRVGFAESPELDRLFSLGWPNLALVGGDSAEPLEDLIHTGVPRRQVWPQTALGPLLRFWLLAPEEAFGADMHGRGGRYDAKGRLVPAGRGVKTLDDPRPPSRVEVEAGLRELAHRTYCQAPVARNWLRVAEAATSTMVVVESLLEELEDWGVEWCTSAHHRYALVIELAFLRDRLGQEPATKLLERLERLWSVAVAQCFGSADAPVRAAREGLWPVRALDLVLHGVHGAKRSASGASGGRVAIAELGVIRDGGSFIAEQLSGTFADPTPDVRRVFEGSEHVLPLEAALWRNYREADDQRLVVDTYGVLNDARIVPWFLEARQRSKVKGAFTKWFERRRAFVAPHLERIARGHGPLVTAAQDLLHRS